MSRVIGRWRISVAPQLCGLRRQLFLSLLCITMDNTDQPLLARRTRLNPLRMPPSLMSDFRVNFFPNSLGNRITQHLFCVQRNPTFEIRLGINEKNFSMLNIGIKGVAQGAPSNSLICYDMFQCDLIKYIQP